MVGGLGLDTVLLLIAISIGLALTALAAAAAAALDEANRVRLRTLTEHEGRRKTAMRRLLDHPPRAWLAELGLGSFGLSLAAAGCAGLARTWQLGAAGAALLGACFLALVIVAGQLAPRGVAVRHPESTALAIAWPVDLAARLFSPLLGWIARALGAEPPAQARALRDGELRALLTADEEDGAIEADEMQMITGVMELGDTKVHEVMVPRIDIVAIPKSASIDEALDAIIQAGHSRIPVYGDTIDDIVGLLYAKDLLSAFRRRDFEASIEGFLREPHFVPESKPVDALLAELKSRQVHMAVVVDEYGGTAGLVTIEDLLEEIVGEIQDEYDAEEPPLVRLGPDEAIVDAGQNIDDVNRMLDLHLPTDEVNTLAGLVFARLGRVPVPGETMVFDDAAVEVLDVEGRRAGRVRIRRQGGGQVAASGAAGHSPPSDAAPPAKAESA